MKSQLLLPAFIAFIVILNCQPLTISTSTSINCSCTSTTTISTVTTNTTKTTLTTSTQFITTTSLTTKTTQTTQTTRTSTSTLTTVSTVTTQTTQTTRTSTTSTNSLTSTSTTTVTTVTTRTTTTLTTITTLTTQTTMTTTVTTATTTTVCNYNKPLKTLGVDIPLAVNPDQVFTVEVTYQYGACGTASAQNQVIEAYLFTSPIFSGPGDGVLIASWNEAVPQLDATHTQIDSDATAMIPSSFPLGNYYISARFKFNATADTTLCPADAILLQ